jgi:hypothetical protein
MVSRSAKKAGSFQRLGSLRSGRHLARFLKGVRRSRAMTAVISGDSAFLLFAHVLLGRLEFAAKPAANVGFHWVPRCRRGLDTAALLALECPAVAARGSALDPGEKHSRVIADRAARPLDRGEVGWVDRLIFRHGTSPRREGYITLGRRRPSRLDGDQSTMSTRRSDSLVNTAHFPILI